MRLAQLALAAHAYIINEVRICPRRLQDASIRDSDRRIVPGDSAFLLLLLALFAALRPPLLLTLPVHLLDLGRLLLLRVPLPGL